MSELSISSSRGSYTVTVASGSASRALSRGSVVIVDETVLALGVLSNVEAPTIPVAGSEQTKTLSGCEQILVEMERLGTRRGDLLVALGGGAVQDAATFVASFYMRGIPWAYVPSTAMAMADSCIGGKSSINIAGIKNLGGNIYPPETVTIDPLLARTLPIAARISGLAEAVKICFAGGSEVFAGYLDKAVQPEDFGETVATDELLLHVLTAKKWFIEVDEFDRAERQLLNFGHTFAHALESATAFAVEHGVAVAVGVLAAVRHPLSAVTPQTLELARYCRDLIRPIAPDLSSLPHVLDWEGFDRAVLSDKKGTKAAIRLILPVDGGGVGVVQIPRSEGALVPIRESMAQALEEVRL